MYIANTGHTSIYVVIDEVTTYLVTLSLYRRTSNEIIRHAFCKHGPKCYLVFDEDQAFLSSVMQYTYKRLGIKIENMSPYYH